MVLPNRDCVYIGPVRLTITLDNLYKRLAAILAVTGIGLGLGWTVVSNFIVRQWRIIDCRFAASG